MVSWIRSRWVYSVMLGIVGIPIILFIFYREHHKLCREIIESDVTQIQILLDQGVKINQRDKWGRNCMHILAAISLYTDRRPINFQEKGRVAQLLIQRGIDINARDDMGNTPLHLTAQLNNYEIAKILVDSGADINPKVYNQFTPLQYAITGRGDLAMVKLLIDHGAEVNVTDSEGSTPLHDAVIKNDPDIIEYLLQHGSDMTAKDNQGRTAIDLLNSQSEPKRNQRKAILELFDRYSIKR